MKTLKYLINRNVKLFFKDKWMFFTSLITPVILLVLYAAFLSNVYTDAFTASIPEGIAIGGKIIKGVVGGQLISSILAVSCVTIAFCSNMLMVQDKANESIKDLTISPVKPWTLALSYYFSTLISTLIICLTTTGVCLVYVACTGWYMSLVDVALLLLDICLLVMFGTALSSVVNFFLFTQGQISAVGTAISSGYGFICGAYMPISQFSEGLQKVISILPGTYGTSLIRNHATRGAFAEMDNLGISADVISAMKDSIDCNIYFFGEKVDIGVMYAVLIGAIILLITAYVLINRFVKRKVK